MDTLRIFAVVLSFGVSATVSGLLVGFPLGTSLGVWLAVTGAFGAAACLVADAIGALGRRLDRMTGRRL